MYRPILNRFGGPPVEWNIIVFFSIIIFSASSWDSSSSAYSIKKSSKEKKNKFLALISIDSKRPFTRTKKGFFFFPLFFRTDILYSNLITTIKVSKVRWHRVVVHPTHHHYQLNPFQVLFFFFLSYILFDFSVKRVKSLRSFFVGL